MNALTELSGDYAAGKNWLLGTSRDVNRHARLAEKARVRTADARLSVEKARATSRDIGSRVWTAEDPADLTDVLDAEANDLQASQAARSVTKILYARQFLSIGDPWAFLRSVCAKAPEDSNIATDVLEGLRIGVVISSLFRKHSRLAPRPEAGRADWEGFDLHAAPIPMLTAVLAHARGTACLAALVDLALSDRPLQPRWRADGVARCWVDGERSLVRLLAITYDDTDVPEDLVPSDQRLGREQISRQHDEGEAVFEAFIRQTAALQ